MVMCGGARRRCPLCSVVLINEVERSPVLFNKTLNDYCDANLKSELWEEVCVSIWRTLAQRRWKNLRTFFARELREKISAQSGQLAGKRRKYKLYHELLFLLPTVEVRATSGNPEPVVSNEESEETENVQRPPIVCSPRTSYNTRKKKESYEETFLDILREKIECASPMDDVATHFILSVIPMQKAIPTHRMIYAEIEIF
ncbi:uncharacterized protein LOC124795743 [Schistocerca piceifrons]|uniref:uncharacterized protein LOC124795743 n=1 Tax=Schistocerca piceifrons TaxID=274613 RepID=UPI001F5FB0BC|nr:uncharacterized protein LOC124795743 [Schistocerca piceifrons]